MTPLRHKILWAAILLLAVAIVSFPRFDCQDLGSLKELTGRNPDGTPSLGDAPQYINYVRHFRGEAAIDGTDVPFRYRPLAPYLASLLPVKNPMTALNLLNLLSMYVGLYFLFRFLRLLGFSFNYAVIGGLMYAVSFPVLYYATTGCVDPLGMAILMTGTYLVFREKWLWLLPLMILGAATKEITLILVPVAFGYLVARRSRWFTIPAVLTVAYAATTIIIRKAVTTGSGFYWTPGLEIFFSNLRFRAIASLILTLGVPGLLSLGFIRFRGKIIALAGWRNLLPLLFGIIFTLLLVVFSMLSAYTDGRFIWPITFYVLPIALWVIRDGILGQAEQVVAESTPAPQPAK